MNSWRETGPCQKDLIRAVAAKKIGVLHWSIFGATPYAPDKARRVKRYSQEFLSDNGGRDTLDHLWQADFARDHSQTPVRKIR